LDPGARPKPKPARNPMFNKALDGLKQTTGISMKGAAGSSEVVVSGLVAGTTADDVKVDSFP